MRKLAYGLFLVFCFFAILTVGSRLFGYRYYTVISDSMHPSIPKFSLVYVKTVTLAEAKALEEGDVIAVKTGDIPVMHRIIEKDDEKIIMHGDHNDEGVNEEVLYQDVIGVVHLSIPVIGLLYINPFILPSLALLIIIIIIIKEIQKEVRKNRG